MRLLRDAMHTNRFVATLVLRNIIIDKNSAEYLMAILQSSFNALKIIYLEENTYQIIIIIIKYAPRTVRDKLS